jgi:hypothetical protein
MPDIEPLDASLLPPRQFFSFSADVRRIEIAPAGKPLTLGERYALPALGALDGRPAFADVRMGWNPQGLVWQVTVEGKTQPLWCRDSRLEDSDGLQVWIDTRATLNIHRASRYCHRYAFLPAGGGRRQDEPLADQLLINRARENARPIRPRELQVASRISKTGYWLAAFIPTVALAGYDPLQYRQLGFTYAIYDRELGLQTFATGPAFPYDEDPTCWATLDLIES